MNPTCITIALFYANAIAGSAYVHKIPLGIGKKTTIHPFIRARDPHHYHVSSMGRDHSHRHNGLLIKNPLKHNKISALRRLGTIARLRSTSNDDNNNTKPTSSSNGSGGIKKFQFKQSDIDLIAIKEKVKTFIQRNIFNIPKDKEFGSSGELFIFMEIALFFCILRGHVPLLQHLISFLFGPVLFLFGITLTGLGIKELNTSSFTALTNPIPANKGGKFVSSGVFSLVRHPVYAGNLYCFIGLSVMTNSSIRLLLTSLYYIVVELKSRQEEFNMEKEFGLLQYKKYKEAVKGKFIPSRDRIFQQTKISRENKNNGDDAADDVKGLLFP